MKLKSLKAA